MLPEEVVHLVKIIQKQKAERQDVEVKAAHLGCPTRLYDTLSSFSNQDQGGTLLFGLDEKADFRVVGVYDLQNLQQKVLAQCQQLEPPVRAVFTVADIDGKGVCTAEIPGLDVAQRPCYYKGAGKVKGSYVRVGDGDLPMTATELYNLETFRKHIHDDENKVEKAVLEALDPKLVQSYITLKTKERPDFAKLPEPLQEELLSITKQGLPTVAGLLNFGLFPQGYFPQWSITAIVVPGKTIGDLDAFDNRFLDNKRIEGNLASMVRQTLQFVSRNMKVTTHIDRVTGLRQDRTEYPIAAVREAILNALIHRDYSFYTEGIPIQFMMFSNRLEIHSPGSLYGRMTVDQLGKSKGDLRNPTLALMAEAMTQAENRYSGIPTMQREMAAYGLPAPVFENRRDEFVVTFYNAPMAGKQKYEELPEPGTQCSEQQLLEYCAVPRSREELARYMGVKSVSYGVNRYIRPLVEQGRLQLTLPDHPKSRHQKYVAGIEK